MRYASSPWTWDWNELKIDQNSDNVDEIIQQQKIVQQVFFVTQSIDKTPMV